MRSAPLLGLLAFCAAPPLAAQRADALRDSALALRATLRQQFAAALATDSNTSAVARHGTLVAMASRGNASVAIDAMTRLETIRSRYFDSAAPAAAGFRLVVRVPATPNPAGGPGGAGQIVLAGLPDTGSAPVRVLFATAPKSADAMLDAYGEVMFASIGPLAIWLETPAPLSIDPHERAHAAYYAVATGVGTAQRRCAGGDPRACAIALLIIRPTPSGSGAAYSPYLRTQFLLSALAAGGPGAWQRLRAAVDTGASVGAAIGAAAGMPLDSLIRVWRRDLFVNRSVEGPLRIDGVLAGVVWCCVAVLLSVGGARWG
ncbi:MAG: hypothetical protein ACREL5_11855 [Gemmatimonadales bacterium]